MPKEMTFALAMRDFFGPKEGEGMAGFMKELKALDEADKGYFKQGLEQNGYTIKTA
jgi:hypothetical protein